MRATAQPFIQIADDEIAQAEYHAHEDAKDAAGQAVPKWTGPIEPHDSSNADILAHTHGDSIRYIEKWNRWIIWDGTTWHIDHGNVRMAEMAKAVGRTIADRAFGADNTDERNRLFRWMSQSFNSARIEGMIKLARGIDGIVIDHNDLDADAWLLGVKNGVVDLHAGTFRQADPNDLMTMQTPTKWNDDAECPRWRQAMEQWFPDAEVRDYVQRLTGYALVGKQVDHVFAIHQGGGRNGKSTYVTALEHALGRYAVGVDTKLLVDDNRYGAHESATATLFRARLAIATETERRVKLRESLIKKLTGNDRIQARRLYENAGWEFLPTHSLWLITNHLPRITGRDEAIWRRIKVIPWLVSFARNEDRELGDALQAEASGILRWAVQGCLMWQERGLAEPESVIRATLQYRQANDLFARFAEDEDLVFESHAQIEAGRLYELLGKWRAPRDATAATQPELIEWLENEKGCDKGRDHVAGKNAQKVMVWHGIGLRDETATEQAPDDLVGSWIAQADLQ